MTTPDRRAHPRHDFALTVHFRTPDATTASTRDLSLGGCAILAPRMRLVNERIPLGLVHPNGQILEVVSEVKRAVNLPDGKWLIGVQFVEMDDQRRQLLVWFIESLAPKKPADEATRLAGEAADAEVQGDVPGALRLLDRAIAADPNRADILVSRARLASQVGDVKGAANFARRAAELEPANTQYAQLYQRFSGVPGASGGASGGGTAPPFTLPQPLNAPPAPSEQKREKSFLPASRRAWAVTGFSALALFGLGGGNLWFWVLRPKPGRPRFADPSPYRELVPLTRLAIRDGKAFGTVGAGWTGLEERAQRVSDLAARLRQDHGATAVVLTDANSRMVASWQNGAARVFPSR